MPVITSHQKFADGTSGLDWTVASGGTLELQRGTLDGASDGAQHAELDGTQSSKISQTLDTNAGATYTVSFDHKARPNTVPATNGLQVTWNGVDIATGVTFGNSWSTYTTQVVGTGSDTLAFADTGTSDGVGTFLDNISVIRTYNPIQQVQNLVSQPTNTAPILDDISDQTINELQTLTVPISASDTDTLSYSTNGTSLGGTISPSGTFSWMPTEQQGPGTYTITIYVTDGTSTVSDTFVVTVQEVPSAPSQPTTDATRPTLTVSNASATEGQDLEFVLTLDKPLAKQLTVSFFTQDYDAWYDDDYVASYGDVTFNPGDTTKTIRVSTISDDIQEGTEEMILIVEAPIGSDVYIPEYRTTGYISDLLVSVLYKEDVPQYDTEQTGCRDRPVAGGAVRIGCGDAAILGTGSPVTLISRVGPTTL